MKKKRISFLAALLAGIALCACSGKEGAAPQSPGKEAGSQDLPGLGKGGNVPGDSSNAFEDIGLRVLSGSDGKGCNTEHGYYYLTEEMKELRDGSYGSRLMYMDFAAGREIYLCSTAGCGHDTLDCPAVFSNDEFDPWSTKLFIFRDSLYLLSRSYDHDGEMSMGIVGFGGDESGTEDEPAVLYRANLDGTDRKKVYTFDSGLTLEDLVLGNEKGIYVITKKLSVDKEGENAYTTSSERKLMFLDLESLSAREIRSMSFEGSISWQVMGCCQNQLVLCGVDYGKELSREEMWDDDQYKELYENSETVYALLPLEGGDPQEICRLANRWENSGIVLGDCLYISTRENQEIKRIHMKTGEQETLCALPQNLIMDTLGDALCCRTWDLSGDPHWYFVDTKTGDAAKSPLVNQTTGWSVELCAETASDLLFIYDYDATGSQDGSYEIHQMKYALIAKEDLFAGKENYRKIEMSGSGL